MKKLVLLGLAILISMSVVAAARYSNLAFTEELNSGNLYAKQQDGQFKFGSWNNLPLATIHLNEPGKTFTGHFISKERNRQEYIVNFVSGDYWANGQIKFNSNIPVGADTLVTEIDIKFIKQEGDAQSTDMWTYRINDQSINGVIVHRESKNQYIITCDGATLYTGQVVHIAQDVSDIAYGDATWNFDITINV